MPRRDVILCKTAGIEVVCFAIVIFRQKCNLYVPMILPLCKTVRIENVCIVIVITPDRWQSKTLILSTNINQK